MGARNQVGIGLSYRPASLCSLATQFQTRFLESIPLPMAGLKFSTLSTCKDGLAPSPKYICVHLVRLLIYGICLKGEL